jgi:CBS domain-containing protein
VPQDQRTLNVQYPGGSFMETRVYSILKRKGGSVVTAVPSQSIASFAALLYAHRIGATPVVDAEHRVVGMISERDVIRGIIEHGASVLALPVSSLMTRLVSTCTPEDKIGDVLEMISLNRTRHIPVVSDGKLEGIVSIGDVVKRLLEEAEFEVSTLRTYITSP